jgi:hypothetical protein
MEARLEAEGADDAEGADHTDVASDDAVPEAEVAVEDATAPTSGGPDVADSGDAPSPRAGSATEGA